MVPVNNLVSNPQSQVFTAVCESQNPGNPKSGKPKIQKVNIVAVDFPRNINSGKLKIWETQNLGNPKFGKTKVWDSKSGKFKIWETQNLGNSKTGSLGTQTTVHLSHFGLPLFRNKDANLQLLSIDVRGFIPHRFS